MSERDLIREALYDAVAWQESLEDAQCNVPEWKGHAQKQANRYKAILRKRYGTDKTSLDTLIDQAETVTLQELQAKAHAALIAKG